MYVYTELIKSVNAKGSEPASHPSKSSAIDLTVNVQRWWMQVDSSQPIVLWRENNSLTHAEMYSLASNTWPDHIATEIHLYPQIIISPTHLDHTGWLLCLISR